MWKPVHRPARRTASASELRRLPARIRRKARSAVVSSRIPGVLQTTTPAAVAAATSMLSKPTATLATTRRRPFPAASTSASKRSVRTQTTPSNPSRRAAMRPSGPRGSSSGRWTTSQGGPGPAGSVSGSVPPAGSGRVTKTRGPAVTAPPSAPGPAGVVVGRLGHPGDETLEAPPAVVGRAVGAGGVADVDAFQDAGALPVGERDVEVEVGQVTPGASGVTGRDVLPPREPGRPGRGPEEGGELVVGFGPVHEELA